MLVIFYHRSEKITLDLLGYFLKYYFRFREPTSFDKWTGDRFAFASAPRSDVVEDVMENRVRK